MTLVEVQQFSLHLKIMLDCGLSLIRSLEILAAGDSPARTECARELISEIEDGQSLSRAMHLQPNNFSPAYHRVIESAEASGTLVHSLSRLCDSLERQVQTHRAVKAALLYPAFLALGCGTLVVIMVYFVFPMLVTMAVDSGAQLPVLTRALQWVAGPKVGLTLVAVVLGSAWWARRLWTGRRTGPPIRAFCEEFTPPGRLFVRLQLLEAMRQFSLLQKSGVGLVRSLTFTAKAAEGSVLLYKAFLDVSKQVKLGEQLHDTFARHCVFPPSLPGMLAAGSESGDIPRLVDYFCDTVDEDVRHTISDISRALEPVVTGVLGAVIALVLLAAFMPMYSLVAV